MVVMEFLGAPLAFRGRKCPSRWGEILAIFFENDDLRGTESECPSNAARPCLSVLACPEKLLLGASEVRECN
jgi:hypothetical protein